MSHLHAEILGSMVYGIIGARGSERNIKRSFAVYRFAALKVWREVPQLFMFRSLASNSRHPSSKHMTRMVPAHARRIQFVEMVCVKLTM